MTFVDTRHLYFEAAWLERASSATFAAIPPGTVRVQVSGDNSGTAQGQLQAGGTLPLAVEMEFDSGQRMVGSVFVSRQQRLPDLLNDERAFLPFETSEGLIKILRKSTIRSVTPLHQVTLPMTSNDPYEILGVAPSIVEEELKNVYHRRAQEPERARHGEHGQHGHGLPEAAAGLHGFTEGDRPAPGVR